MIKIGYIIKTKKDKYKAFVGTPIKDDDDSFIDVLASGIVSEDLEEVQKFLQENDQGIDKIVLNPINASFTGITWLSELE